MAADAAVDNKSFRLLALLHALPVAPRRMEAKELQQVLQSEGYVCDKRTVERDLNLLLESQFGYLIECDDRARPYGWSICSDQYLSIPAMDEKMAATWFLVERYLQPLMPRDALQKLAPIFDAVDAWFKKHKPTGGRSWKDKVAYVPRGFSLQQASVPTGIVDAVYGALYRNRQMDIWYKDRKSPKRVHPLALVDRGAVRYLIARFEGYDNYRHLALHRLSRVEILDDPVQGMRAFDLNSYLRNGNMNLPYGERISLELLFYDQAGDHLYETPLNQSQKLAQYDEGAIKMTVDVEHTEELKWWILGFGAKVAVLAPASLRDEIEAELDAVVLRYR